METSGLARNKKLMLIDIVKIRHLFLSVPIVIVNATARRTSLDMLRSIASRSRTEVRIFRWKK